MLDEIPTEVQYSQGGAEADVRRETGEDVVPHREDTELLETADLHGQSLQAVVTEVQVVKTPQLSDIRRERDQAVVVQPEFLEGRVLHCRGRGVFRGVTTPAI